MVEPQRWNVVILDLAVAATLFSQMLDWFFGVSCNALAMLCLRRRRRSSVCISKKSLLRELQF